MLNYEQPMIPEICDEQLTFHYDIINEADRISQGDGPGLIALPPAITRKVIESLVDPT